MNMALQLRSNKVAVIGAGAAGLVAARELEREGHKVVVFERQTQLGGTWVYSPEVESDPLGLDPTRKRIHSSLYSSLRTNLAREAMGFRDFPFVSTGKADRDSRRFPAHHEVLRYLEDFANEFRLNELIRYETEVSHVELGKDGKWTVKCRSVGRDGGNEVEETYDAVVVCTGHLSEPRTADDIPGIELWPGKQIHSHNYRIPEPYKDQVVVIIGSASSALDICRDIAGVAKEVHLAIRSETRGRFENHPIYDNMQLHPMIERTHQDGRISFLDGSVIHANVILHCTGYKYHFPFLDKGGVVSVDDNRVGPLYKHVFPPTLAPGISFIGLTWMVIPFFVCELQSKWVARALSRRVSLPSEQKMLEDIEAFYAELEAKQVSKRFTHMIYDSKTPFLPFEYQDWLAEQSGCDHVEEWRKNMFIVNILRSLKHTETFRDEWDDEDLVQQAHQDFIQYLSVNGKAFVVASTI